MEQSLKRSLEHYQITKCICDWSFKKTRDNGAEEIR